jgi:hypothetical protein
VDEAAGLDLITRYWAIVASLSVLPAQTDLGRRGKIECARLILLDQNEASPQRLGIVQSALGDLVGSWEREAEADAELVRLRGKLVAATAELERVNADDTVSDEGNTAAYKLQEAILDHITALPAHGINGWRAKAAALLESEDDLAVSLANDLLRDGTTPPPTNPDTALVDLHHQLVEQTETMAASCAIKLSGDGVTPESEAQEQWLAGAQDAWDATARQIAATPAHGGGGLRTKATVLLLVLEQLVCDRLGTTVDDIASGTIGYVEHGLALSLARDLLRDTGMP